MAEKGINIYIGATSLRSCLGNKSQTIEAIHRGESGLFHSDTFSMCVGQAEVEPIDGHTRFESIIIEQIDAVLSQSGISLADKSVQLVISTTKGNIELLAKGCEEIAQEVFISNTAATIASYFGAANSPIVVSNACISGLSAFIIAKRELESGRCRHAVVVGGDVLSEFITAGFASFKSISPQPCRPYDAERDGLTLGEAAGAVILTTERAYADEALIRVAGSAISNDANHISGPSRTGDGLYYAIHNAMVEAGVGCGDVAFINTHGTATRFNDEMESKAVAWAGLCDTPLNSLKGYIGHTLGASGVVEAILCVEQMKQGYIFGTTGFVSSDVPHALKLSATEQPIRKGCCVKTASGFGGCNAAIVLDSQTRENNTESSTRRAIEIASYELPQTELPFAEFIRAEFKSFGESNIKFYKMSDMSKALYVAVEHLLSNGGFNDIDPTRRAIILANRASSLDADIVHQQVLNQHNPEGASPAAFVYTLANVAAGEMCIRHKIQGENTFFIEERDSGLAERYARELIERGDADGVICGWCDYLEGKWSVNIKLLKTE